MHGVTLSSQLTTLSRRIPSAYPPRKQLIWRQCQDYLKYQSFVLLQLDNLDTKDRLGLKDRLKSLGLSLKTPKAHILKKVMQSLGHRSLQASAVGFMGIAISKRPLLELRDAVAHIKSQPRVTLLGGKFDSYTFTDSGVTDLVVNCPPIDRLRWDLITCLTWPGASISSILVKSQSSISALLEQRAGNAGSS